MPQPLDRRLPLAWVIAWRYLRGRRSRMLSGTATAALCATTLGVTAMVIAMALMSGYTQDLMRKLMGLQGEIVASPLGDHSLDKDANRLAQAAALPAVERMGRVLYGEGSIQSPKVPEGASVVLRGIDPSNDGATARMARDWGQSPEQIFGQHDGLPGLVVGSELARQLNLSVGDPARLVVLELKSSGRPRFHYRSVRITGTFTMGFAEFDGRWALIDHQVLGSIRGASSPGLEVMEFDLVDGTHAEELAAEISDLLGPSWLVQPWLRLNRQLFTALELQEMLLFLVLGLIVVVSTFNVASTLVILVRERHQDIGVLSALGLSPRSLWWIFTGYGLALGFVGIALGMACGVGISWLVTEFELIRFDPEVAKIYFIDSVPFRVELGDLAAIAAFAVTVTLAACALPARRAARLDPATALRSE